MLAEHPELFPRLDHYIVLDLEYDNDHTIWLVCAAEVGNRPRQYHFWWADSPAQEEAALQKLKKLPNRNSKVPAVTWGGKSADGPVLGKMAKAYGMPEVLVTLDVRHVDMFQWAQPSFRMPVPGLDLKSISEAFGFEKVSSIRSGLQALGLYHKYRASETRNYVTGYSSTTRTTWTPSSWAVDGFRGLVEFAGSELKDPGEADPDLSRLGDGA